MAETETAQDKPQIAFDEFAKVDLRVATITQAEFHPNADRLLKLQVDDGSGEPRQICAGIKAWYAPEDLMGKQVVIVANLAPRTIRGEESRGMIVAATDRSKGEGNEVVTVLTPQQAVANGSLIS